VTYRDKLAKCGIKIKETATEQDCKEAWDIVADNVDKAIAKMEKKRREKK
jgi:hypothetical protein